VLRQSLLTASQQKEIAEIVARRRDHNRFVDAARD
jgi:hypothetical protein